VALALLADEMMVFICLVLSRGLGMIDSIQKQFFFSSGKPYLMVMKQAQHPNLFFFFPDFNFHYFQTSSQPTSDNLARDIPSFKSRVNFKVCLSFNLTTGESNVSVHMICSSKMQN
jgi:hypothetical protein